MKKYITMTNSYYAVHKGRTPGVYMTWKECQLQIQKFSGAIYKKFSHKQDAERFVKNGSTPLIRRTQSKPIAIPKNTYHTLGNNIRPPSNTIYVYTDGSCHGNGTKHAKAGMGVYFKENDNRNVSRRISGKQTNNCAELRAILEVFTILWEEIIQKIPIVIYTDSKYCILCCTTYGLKLHNRFWKSSQSQPIPNIELVKELFITFQKHSNVSIQYIAAHTDLKDRHSLGNFHADRLANESLGNTSTNSTRSQSKKIYLSVPIQEKDDAKKLGARWDFRRKKWYISETHKNSSKLIQKWKK